MGDEPTPCALEAYIKAPEVPWRALMMDACLHGVIMLYTTDGYEGCRGEIALPLTRLCLDNNLLDSLGCVMLLDLSLRYLWHVEVCSDSEW